MQRSPQFLRAVFRIYTESIWYPGRQLNMISIKNNLSSPKPPTVSGSAIIDTTDNDRNSDFIEPPKFITGKHVAAVFERLGYDSLAGYKLFAALCEAQARRKRLIEEGSGNSGREFHSHMLLYMCNLSFWCVLPSLYSFLMGSCSPDMLEDDGNPDNAQPPRSPSKKPAAGRNAALTALVGNLADSVSTAVTSIGLGVSPGGGEVNAGGGVHSHNTTASSLNKFGASVGAQAGSGSGEGGASSGEEADDVIARSESYKMDVQDFIAAVEIDDVLIQVSG